MSVYRVTENQEKPLAPYLQPSRAGFAPSDASGPSVRLTGTQVLGILLAIGCLVLLFLSVSTPSAPSDSSGQLQNVATAQRQVSSSR